MVFDKLPDAKVVTITNQGMITIPARFRKHFKLKDGDKIFIFEDEGCLKLIPIRPIEELRKGSYTTEQMLKSIEESRNEELEQENK